MCVTLHDARLGRTALAGWRYPGRQTHCLAYGNEPENRSGKPNVMLLHIPLAYGAVLTRDNFIPAQGLGRFLEDMWRAAPKWPGGETARTLGSREVRGSVSVFSMGSYTWVTATQADPDDIAAALDEVPAHRRPAISRQLIGFYQRTWPYALALGCFSTRSGDPAEPAVIEYPPQDWDILRMPATDAHGTIPAWGERVRVDHRIIIGTGELGLGGPVTYTERNQMDPLLRDTLPSRTVAAEIPGAMLWNGDFYVNFRELARNGDVRRANGPVLDAGAERIPVRMG